MKDTQVNNVPKLYSLIQAKSTEIGFSMPSDQYIGALLKTLVASKPQGKFLELGTGIGLSLSWMIDGMDAHAQLITIDNNPKLIEINNEFFSKDNRVTILCEDGSKWLKENAHLKFDLIFADAWPGKYSEIEIALNMINIGGIYIVDDMSIQPNWPKGHYEKSIELIKYLEERKDFHLTKMNWSTGIIMMSKINDKT